MEIFFVALLVLVSGGILAGLTSRHARVASCAGMLSAFAGSFLGLLFSVEALLSSTPLLYTAPWKMPYAALSFRIDPLSGLFLSIIFGLSLLSSLYGGGYLMHHASERKIGLPWFFFNLLTASMAMVVASANAVFFIIAWETMSLSSFFLVTFENDKPDVRYAGFVYLIATHIGTAFLLVMFLLLSQQSKGSMEFESFAQAHLTTTAAGVIFVLSVIGFGTKAGFIPFHVWLPEAHPAAPSHVSAILSGVMIKTGIYGILRTLTFLGLPPTWWGGLLVTVGLVSGVAGIAFALSQHDFKKVLAYSSVENIGIIAMGMGMGLLGLSFHSPLVAILGFAGALLHVLNHSIFKSLLFLCSGCVLQKTHTREIDRLGGLFKKMPITGFTFLVGAVAICGLPPFNGFIGEFLIYVSSFTASYRNGTSWGIALAFPLLVIVGLSLIGGLAVICFTKTFAVVYLGEPRTPDGEHASDPSPVMWFPMAVLASLCLLVGVLPFCLIQFLFGPISVASGIPLPVIEKEMAVSLAALGNVVKIFMILGGALVFLAILRHLLLRSRTIGKAGTWDCGYLAPGPKLQYTASSYVQPIVDLGAWFLRVGKKTALPQGYFPGSSRLSSHPLNTFMAWYGKVFHGIEQLFSKLHCLQHGRLHLYVLYIAATLLALLVWHIGGK